MTAVHHPGPDQDRTTAPLPPDPFQPTRDHEFDHVEEHADGFVLQCTCGWASEPSRSAEAVGTAWDRHRSEVGATDW